MSDEILHTLNCMIQELEQVKLSVKELEEALKGLKNDDYE
jgi:hypothetical protein